MGSFSASIPITVLGHYYPSLDAACLSYEISRANCLKKAKRRGVPVYDVILEEAEKVQRLRNLRQDFALGKYTRRKVNGSSFR